MTPPEVLRLPDQNDASSVSKWTVRVVPNKYPAVVEDGNATRMAENHEARGGIGAQRSQLGRWVAHLVRAQQSQSAPHDSAGSLA